ncbi:CAAX protease [Helicobacter pylori]|uniref:CAAX protease n=1 Tax=Helicobacter pylori TaxID=210 RepID=UPI0009A2EA28|nr:CAAX protease [Helicobacter pylori]KAA6492148.1 CAAX protease [Helicobacter pylori]KAA6513093.1 CAAX protease [Helicobacter pylori]OPG63014.1 CAAX protease [Helicobacter pylori]QEF40141.1 CAAX protease [Helicobacter pylori]WRE59987.1 CAAX protease [Helicobacter pylori]
MQDLKHFKNDITLILSKERLDTYDSLEQYKENLKLIASITPKISNLEIYLRNALDHCLTQIKGSDWVFNESALTPLIKELKEKKKEITHSLILSKMSLGAVIRLIFCYKLEGVVLDLRAYRFRAYYHENKDTLLIKNRKQNLSNYAKAHIALNLLWTIRNRAYHWENLLKIQPNKRPRIATPFNGKTENIPMDKILVIGIEPNKITLFLDDLIKSIGNKNLESLSSL